MVKLQFGHSETLHPVIPRLATRAGRCRLAGLGRLAWAVVGASALCEPWPLTPGI